MSNSLTQRAANYAAVAHLGVVRKYTGEPYFNHVAEVALFVRCVGLSDEAIAAAYLHDVVEDTDISNDDIRSEFGDRVADLVEMLTDVSVPSDGNRAFRKTMDRDHSAKSDFEGKSIKLADLISNTASIVEHDKHFAVTYLREKAELLKVLLPADGVLYKTAKQTYDQAMITLEQDKLDKALDPNHD